MVKTKGGGAGGGDTSPGSCCGSRPAVPESGKPGGRALPSGSRKGASRGQKSSSWAFERSDSPKSPSGGGFGGRLTGRWERDAGPAPQCHCFLGVSPSGPHSRCHPERSRGGGLGRKEGPRQQPHQSSSFSPSVNTNQLRILKRGCPPMLAQTGRLATPRRPRRPIHTLPEGMGRKPSCPGPSGDWATPPAISQHPGRAESQDDLET